MSNTPVVDDDPSRADPDGEVADFTVVVTEDGGQTVAHITGEIDIATCERLRDAIEPHLGPGQRVVLDLSGVTFMDSSCRKSAGSGAHDVDGRRRFWTILRNSIRRRLTCAHRDRASRALRHRDRSIVPGSRS